MNHKDFDARIEKNAEEGRYLEAFLLSMAYLEISLNFYLYTKIYIASGKLYGKNKVMDALYAKVFRMRVSEVLDIIAKLHKRTKPEFIKNLRGLFEKRNQMLHDVVANVILNDDIDEEVKQSYLKARKFLRTRKFKEIRSWIEGGIDLL